MGKKYSLRKVGNKKVKNAKKCEYNNIKFKSGLELYCYKELLKLVPDPGYEATKTVLLEGFSPDIFIYDQDKEKNMVLNTSRVREITYTCDFNFEYKDKNIFIETKGMITDVFVLKRKMFLNKYVHYISRQETFFFQPRNQRQVLQCINIIKNL